MKYKLINYYPPYKKKDIGKIVWFGPNNLLGPENYPEFWELIVEKDYEILSLIEGKIIYPCDKYSKDYINQLFNTLGVNIHSVKRKDGEVFTIGDKTEFGDIIKYFKIDNKSNLLIIGYKDCEDILEFVKHSKQKLFATEDGVDIFEGDLFYYVKFVQYNNTLGKPFEIVRGDYSSFEYEPQYEKYFSTKEKAEEYILLNKPILSLKDIASIYPGINKSHPDKPSSQSERLKNLVKSKIQQSV